MMGGWPLAASKCQNAGGQKPPANREPSMGEITTVGLDLAKNVFQVHGVDAEGATVLRKRFGGRRCWRSSASCRAVWWEWKRVRQRTIGHENCVRSAMGCD